MDREDFFELLVVFKLIVGTLSCDRTITHQDDSITQMQVVGRVSDQDSSFVFADTL